MTAIQDRAKSGPTYLRGIALCVVSALGFALLPIFGKGAYAAGVNVPTLLFLRFGLAALIFWVIVVMRRRRAKATGPLTRRSILVGLGLGAFGYAIQASFFFAALSRLDAGLTSLLLYTFPGLVFVATVALGRERVSGRAVVALVCAVGGVALVLVGSGVGQLSLLGVVFGLSSAVMYSGYLMGVDAWTGGADPLVVSALICTGACIAHLVIGTVGGSLHLDVAPAGWLSIIGLAVVSTVLSVSLLLAGIQIVGAPTASIVSCAEPVGTVLLAVVLYGEPFGPAQIVGTAAVVAAVVLLQRRAIQAGPA